MKGLQKSFISASYLFYLIVTLNKIKTLNIIINIESNYFRKMTADTTVSGFGMTEVEEFEEIDSTMSNAL